MNNALSVVIPAHNAAESIPRCLDSLVRQDLANFEVIIVDDGSSDDLWSAAEPFSSRLNLRYYSQESQGVSVARNLGLKMSLGDWLMFVDADDEVVGESLGGICSAAESTTSDIVISDFLLSTEGSTHAVKALNRHTGEFSRDCARVFQWLCLARVGFRRKKGVGLLGAPWAKLYRRSFLSDTFANLDAFTPGVRRGQDVLFNVEAFGRMNGVFYFGSPTYIYNVSTTSFSHKSNSQFVQDVETLVSSLDALVERMGSSELLPAVARMSMTLFDEAILRTSETDRVSRARELVNEEPFVESIERSRYRDSTVPGMIKLLLLRLGLFRLYSLLLTLRR